MVQASSRLPIEPTISLGNTLSSITPPSPGSTSSLNPTSPSAPTLPPELHGKIIDYLPAAALVRCSLVNHSWSTFAQELLYRHLDLYQQTQLNLVTVQECARAARVQGIVPVSLTLRGAVHRVDRRGEDVQRNASVWIENAVQQLDGSRLVRLETNLIVFDPMTLLSASVFAS